MDDLLDRGLKFFEAGRYFDAHEAWEDLWRVTPSGPARLFYQGLIQGAVGLHHFSRGNQTGARSQLVKALAKLEGDPPHDPDLDLDGIIGKLRSALALLPSG